MTEAKANGRRNQLNDLSATEWLPLTKSFWMQQGLGKDHKEAEIERLHPAPYSFSDIRKLVRFFSKLGENVLDPFAGVASTLKACAAEGRLGTGIELVEEWARLGELRLEREVSDARGQSMIVGDALSVLRSLPDESYHFVCTSPPYWGILNKRPDHKVKSERVANGLAVTYSNDPRDLANIPAYSEFISAVTQVFEECARVLQPKRYMVVVVSDFRHGSRFHMYHADLASSIEEESSFKLEGITILAQNQKKLFPYGYPAAFVSNIHHQYILIFRNHK